MWEDNSKMDLRKIEWSGMDQKGDKWKALVNTAMNFGSMKCLELHE
jgi:hypothetical protein